jgi:hypothetical protein
VSGPCPTDPTRYSLLVTANPLIRWASFSFAALFALSAAVQVNDPDWGPWFVFYVAATVVAAIAPHWRHGRLAAAMGLALSVAWGALILSYGLESITLAELFGDLRMKTLNVERWREFGGLLITGGWMTVLVGVLRGEAKD